MATLTIRNLPEGVRRALRERAASRNRSMEAEARSILRDAVLPRDDFVADWVAATAELRGDLELPVRSPARSIDLS